MGLARLNFIDIENIDGGVIIYQVDCDGRENKVVLSDPADMQCIYDELGALLSSRYLAQIIDASPCEEGC